MKTLKSIIGLLLAVLLLTAAPLTVFAQEGEDPEIFDDIPEESLLEQPGETVQDPSDLPARDSEMIGNYTDSSRLPVRTELTDVYGQTQSGDADVVKSLISSEARQEFSSAIDAIADFEPVGNEEVSTLFGRIGSFLANDGIEACINGNLLMGAEIGLTENREDKVKILGADTNSSAWVFVVDKDAMSWFVKDADGMGIPNALVTISFLNEEGTRKTRSVIATAGHTPGIAVFDDLPDSFFGIVDIQAEGYHAVSILDKMMGSGEHYSIVLDGAMENELYIRGVDLAGKDMINEETSLSLVTQDTEDLSLRVLVTKNGNAQFPASIDIRSDNRGSTVLSVSETAEYPFDGNTRIYTASRRWVEKGAGLLKDGDQISIDLGSVSVALEHTTVEDAVVTPGAGETEVPVTTKNLSGNVTDRLSGSGFLNQTMQMLRVPVNFGMFPDGSMVLMAAYDITQLDPNTQYKFNSLFAKSWNPKDTENLQKPLEIFEKSFWENTEKVKKGKQILESENKIKCVSNFNYDFSMSFSLYLRSCYNKGTDDNYGTGGIMFCGSLTGGITEYFLLPAGPIVIPAYLGFDGHISVNTALNVSFGMDQPPTGHDQDKEWRYATDDGTDVNARIEIIVGCSVFGGVGVKGVLGVSATGYVDFDIATVIGKGKAEFGQPHSFIDVLYGLKFHYYLLFYSGTITIDALNGAERLDDSQGEQDLLTAAFEEMELTDIPLTECAEDFVLQVTAPDERHDEMYTLQNPGETLEGNSSIVPVDKSTYPDTQLQFAATKDYTALFRLASNGHRTDIYYQLQNRESGNLYSGLYKVRLPAGETRSVTEFVVVPNRTDLDDPEHCNKVYLGAVLADNTLTEENARMKSTDVAAFVVDLGQQYTVSAVIASDPSMQGEYWYSAPRPAGREDICAVTYAATRLTDENGVAVNGVKALFSAAPDYTYYYLSWGEESDPSQRTFRNLGQNKIHSSGAIAPNEPSFWTVDPLRSSDKYLVVRGYGANGYYAEDLRCNFRIDIDGIIDKQDLINGSHALDSIISNWQYLNGCNYFIAGDSVYWMNKVASGTGASDYQWQVEKVVNGSGVISVDDRYAMITNNNQSAVYLVGVVGDYDVNVEAGTSEKGHNIAKIHTITTFRDETTGETTCSLHGPLELRFAEGDAVTCFAAAYNPEECQASGLTIAYSSPGKDGSDACMIRMWKQNADRGLRVTRVAIPDYRVIAGQPAIEAFVTVRNYGYGRERAVPYVVHDETGRELMMTNGEIDFSGESYTYTGEEMYTGDSRVDRILIRPNPDWSLDEEHEILVEVRKDYRYDGDLDDVVNSAGLTADATVLTAKNTLVGGRHCISAAIVNKTMIGQKPPAVKVVLDYGDADVSRELLFQLPSQGMLRAFDTEDETFTEQVYYYDIDMNSVWEEGIKEGLRGARISLVDEYGSPASVGTVYLSNPAEKPREEGTPEFKKQNLVLSGQIGVNFFLDLSSLSEEERSASYMEFTISGKGDNGTTDAFDENHKNATGEYYGFTFYVRSIQMADTITAVYHYGDGKTISKTYSVEEYFQVFDEHASENPAKTVALVHAIADYGYYMQRYLAKVNGFTLGKDYAEQTRHYTESYDYADILSKVEPEAIARALGTSKVEKANYRLQLGSETTLDVFLKTKDGSAPADVTVTIDEVIGGKTTTTAYTPEKQADGRYLVTIQNISAHRLGDRITITGTADGTFTVEVSPLSFVRDVLTHEKDAESRNGVSSLYALHAAAKACIAP